MLDTLKEALPRILGSQKMIYAQVPVAANIVGRLFGMDIMDPLLLVVDAGFWGLAIAQFALDLRWGSPSDGTGDHSE